MLFSKGLKRYVDESMVKYCTNQDNCRRHTLFCDFDDLTRQIVVIHVVISVVLAVTVTIVKLRCCLTDYEVDYSNPANNFVHCDFIPSLTSFCFNDMTGLLLKLLNA